MLVSHRWLRELLGGLEAPALEVAERLTAAGLAVDAITDHGAALLPCRVVAVRSIDPHPKLSKVRLVTVDTGEDEQQVVCGASNVPAPGGKVVLCPLGTTLPAVGMTISERDIGGVTSRGMLASESELGLADSSSGILVLPDDVMVGSLFVEACPEAADTIFDLDITPNRPDALGHIGVARDLAALYQLDFRMPKPGNPSLEADTALDSLISVENLDLERCPHYAAGAVLDIRLGPSPARMRWRLYRLGMRPISNVVDVTNWLMLEYGQPLHAFDLDKVRGKRVIIRRAKGKEPFQTLDGVDRTLDQDDLVIADSEGPSALAGVMGGSVSEISETTRRVLVECAHFAPRGVRRTARRHGMHTESSHRFERGTDLGNVSHVLERAKVMLSELASAKAVRGALHLKAPDREAASIQLREQRLNRLLGVSMPFDEVTGLLERIGLHVSSVTDGPEGKAAAVMPASHRPDVIIEADLIDEVARLRGLDRIPTILPGIARAVGAKPDIARRAASEACALGLTEALTYSFVSEETLRAISAPEPIVRLDNPLSQERAVMRTSLLPGLIDALRRAQRNGQRSGRLFSVATVFLPPVVNGLPQERRNFAAVLAGPRKEHLSPNPPMVDTFDAKGIATELCARLARQEARVTADSALPLHLHPRFSGVVQLADSAVGVVGKLHPDVLKALDISVDVVVVELDLEQVSKLGASTPRYQPIPRLPAVTRDLSLVVTEQVPAQRIEQVIKESVGELCESVEVTAEYRGGSVPEAHRSLTFHLVYRHPKASGDVENARTLTDEEVDQVQTKALRQVESELKATLRG